MSLFSDPARPLSPQAGQPYRRRSIEAVNALADSDQTSAQVSSRFRDVDYEFPGDLAYLKYRRASDAN